MKTGTAWLGIGFCMLIGGCNPSGGGGAKLTQFTFVTGDPVPCDTTGGTEESPVKCKITVKADVKKNRCVIKEFDKPFLQLQNQKHAMIVWKLENDFRFCPALGDGVFLKDIDVSDTTISDVATSTDHEGTPDPKPSEMKCRKFFRWRDNNQNSTTYEYVLQFRSKDDDSVVCRVDPFVKNG